MKKIMCALLFLLVLLWHCNPALAAKGRSKGKSGSSSARFSRTKGKNTAAGSDRYIRPNKAGREKTSTRQKAVRVEKPRAAKARATRETMPKVKSQKPKDSAIPRVKEQKEKPAGQGKEDRPAQAKPAQEEKPAKGKGRQEVKSQKKIEKAATEVKELKEKPAGQGKKDRPAQVKSAKEEKPGKGKGKQEVKSQKKIGKAAGQNAEEKGKAKGKFHKQQQTAFQKQLLHEGQKHLKRAARLERMRVLALKQGDAKKVARIEKLMAREQQRYGQKHKRMLGQEGKVEKKAEESPSKNPGQPPAL